MQQFYNPEVTEESSQITFSKEESRHIVKVLRKQVGDLLHITNGKGWMFYAEIVIPNIKLSLLFFTEQCMWVMELQ